MQFCHGNLREASATNVDFSRHEDLKMSLKSKNGEIQPSANLLSDPL